MGIFVIDSVTGAITGLKDMRNIFIIEADISVMAAMIDTISYSRS
jgi:hypothetical protein